MNSFMTEALFELAKESLLDMLNLIDKGTEGGKAVHQTLARMQERYEALMQRHGLSRPAYAVDHEQLASIAMKAVNLAIEVVADENNKSKARRVFWAEFNKAIQPRLF